MLYTLPSSSLSTNVKVRSKCTNESEGTEAKSRSFFVRSQHSVSKGPRMECVYDVSWLQRVFVTFDQPESCIAAEIMSMVMMMVIIFSCTSYVLSSDPGFRYVPSSCKYPVCKDDPNLCPGSEMCEPVEPQVFELLEAICISIFTVDYVVRVGLVGIMPARLGRVLPSNWDVENPEETAHEPTYSWHYQTYKYITQSMNIIDLVAILPFYIGLGSGGGAGSVSIVRILRLARVLRVFKIGGFSSGMTLIGRAIHNSLPAIGILFFFATLGVILFGSIIYFVESGTYVVNEDFPEGEYVRWNFNHSEKEKSPFVSILVACYWAVVTSTTVGYGELHPTSPLGRFLSMVLMYVGILVLALPISVIGAAFTREYEKQHAADEISVAGGNTKGRGGEVDAERRHLLSLSFREEEEEEEVVVEPCAALPLANGSGTGNRRSKAEIKRELTAVSRQLCELAATVNTLLEDLDGADPHVDSPLDDAISTHSLNPLSIDNDE